MSLGVVVVMGVVVGEGGRLRVRVRVLMRVRVRVRMGMRVVMMSTGLMSLGWIVTTRHQPECLHVLWSATTTQTVIAIDRIFFLCASKCLTPLHSR